MFQDPAVEHASETLRPEEEEPPSPSPFVIPRPAAVPLPRAAIVKNLPDRRPPRTGSITRAFRRAFYPGVTDREWNDWRWQISNRVRRLSQLEKMIRLSAEERFAFGQTDGHLPLGITPYYMSLLAPDDPAHPLRRTVIPSVRELDRSPGESDDPLDEEAMSPVPGLVHRYPDRVLLLLLDFCSTYCRYCTRSRVVGHGAIRPSESRLRTAFDYIRRTPTIRDVVLSGGDPLTLSDDRLDWILSELRQIPHLEIIRIGTKVPAVLPQRVTPGLVKMLRRHHPVFMSLHFTHPDECTPETYRAATALADAGIPLGSQTVLLSGINDDLDTMKKLVQNLLKMRVRPYYLYQCDPISGSAHFRTPVEKGIEIIQGLRGFTSGYAVPSFVIDAPGGGGKIPVTQDNVTGRTGDGIRLRNYEGHEYFYPDAVTASPV